MVIRTLQQQAVGKFISQFKVDTYRGLRIGKAAAVFGPEFILFQGKAVLLHKKTR